ncbi:MAG: hypothetical protein LBU32_29640 [Clostridiales bacterium]|jgi:hypothetical protein|nr:hypothetical protein [Clostridiales bacterium]
MTQTEVNDFLGLAPEVVCKWLTLQYNEVLCGLFCHRSRRREDNELRDAMLIAMASLLPQIVSLRLMDCWLCAMTS